MTGAFSYTGRHIAQRLIDQGQRVRTLTGHPQHGGVFDGQVEARPYRFEDPDAMVAAFDGVSTLYNTYWVRFDHGSVRFDTAIEHSKLLFEAAARAGVGRIVHVSITNPSASSPFPYFRGKAAVETALASTGVPYGIVRPTVVFGGGDVLINNIAWIARRFPVFPLAGRGDYQVRPVHVDDVARLCVEAGAGPDNVTVDAAGPETFTFEDLVRVIATAVHTRPHLLHLPAPVVSFLGSIVGRIVDDVLLTQDELAGLQAGLVTVDGPATGTVSLSAWIAEHAATLGLRYASELDRHFRHI